MQLSDLLTSEDSLKFNGYLIRKAMRTYTFDDMDGYRSDQGYVVISRGATQFRSFDAGLYHPAGNRAAFGLVPFLGTQSQQVVISQDISRGGAQWIVDLSSTPRVIFDGPAWGVGRESDDCEVEDVDGDGIFEISLPITDFYALMDKVGMAGIPLPMITFKYDSTKRSYFPVNHLLDRSSEAFLQDAPREPEPDEPYFVQRILGPTLDLVYAGKRAEAWQYFNGAYNLDDKKEIERRVQEILRDQLVYKYIYKQ